MVGDIWAYISECSYNLRWQVKYAKFWSCISSLLYTNYTSSIKAMLFNFYKLLWFLLLTYNALSCFYIQRHSVITGFTSIYYRVTLLSFNRILSTYVKLRMRRRPTIYSSVHGSKLQAQCKMGSRPYDHSPHSVNLKAVKMNFVSSIKSKENITPHNSGMMHAVISIIRAYPLWNYRMLI